MNRNSESPAAPPQRAWLMGLFLAAAVIIACQPAWHAGFIWDDDRYVTENALLTAHDGLRRIWFSLDAPSQYFPLTYTTFYVERLLWGFNPAGYHLVNILLHAANALLVWRVLARLGVPGAWLAAALFALHPVQVESVAWISERKNVLMGFFFLLTILSWMKFMEEENKRRWGFYFAALVLYGLSLSAKTTACTLPSALLLILWLKKIPINRKRLAKVAPFVAMGIGMGLVTVWWERYHQGTAFHMGLVERILIASRALWFYAGKLIWPANLTFSYPRWQISPADPRAYGWLIATGVLGIGIWRIRRWTGRSVEVAALYFAATLSPVLGILMLYTFRYTFVADHYQYLACIGPFALAAAGLNRAAAARRFLAPVFFVALPVSLGALTWEQCRMYSDAKTLWQTTARRNPDSWMAHSNLGGCLMADNKVDEAAKEFREAIRLAPDSAEPYNNLGRIFAAQEKPDDAAAMFAKAISINPNLEPAHYNLGNLDVSLGKTGPAIAELQAAVQLKPDDIEAQKKLAEALIKSGRAAEAIPICQAVVAAWPDNPPALFALASAYLGAKQPAEAAANFKEAVRLAPNTPQCLNALAWIYAACPKPEIRNGPEAVRLAVQACEISKHQSPEMLDTLAAAYAETGRFDDAIKTTGEMLALAEARHDKATEATARQRLELYKAGKPYRDEP